MPSTAPCEALSLRLLLYKLPAPPLSQPPRRPARCIFCAGTPVGVPTSQVRRSLRVHGLEACLLPALWTNPSSHSPFPLHRQLCGHPPTITWHFDGALNSVQCRGALRYSGGKAKYVGMGAAWPGPSSGETDARRNDSANAAEGRPREGSARAGVDFFYYSN